MSNANLRRTAAQSAAIILASLLAYACSSDAPAPSAPASISASKSDGGKVSVCHKPDGGGKILSLSANALSAHLGHGDYVAGYEVDHNGPPTDGVHFATITEALDSARATRRARSEMTSAGCRITIDVAKGTYVGSFSTPAAGGERLPYLITVPDITLRGAFTMRVDARGRATGTSTGDTTTLGADRALIPTEAYVVVADDADGYHGDRAVIEGFRFLSGNTNPDAPKGGIGVGSLRAKDLSVRGNLFEVGMQGAANLRASTADLSANYARRVSDGSCTFCLAGPGAYTVHENRLLDPGFTNVFMAALVLRAPFPLGSNPLGVVVPPYVVPTDRASYTGTITNNDLSYGTHQPKGFGSGVRLVPYVSDADIPQSGTVVLSDNTMLKNNFALTIEPNTPTTGISPVSQGNITVTAIRNEMGPSCRNNMLVSFARISRTIGVPPGTEGYLANSTFTLILDSTAPFDKAWFDNSAPGNSLYVNGELQPHIKRTSPSDNPAGCA